MKRLIKWLTGDKSQQFIASEADQREDDNVIDLQGNSLEMVRETNPLVWIAIWVLGLAYVGISVVSVVFSLFLY